MIQSSGFTSPKTRGNIPLHYIARLLDLEELDVEDEGAVAGDAGQGPAAVRHVGGDSETPLAADGQAEHTDVPALDDLALANLEAERLALLVGCARNMLASCRRQRGRKN